MIYRMASPDNATEADLERLSEEFHIKTILDLRREVEVKRSSGTKLIAKGCVFFYILELLTSTDLSAKQR